MDLSGALLDEVILEVYDEEWVRTVDYEHIPFRCHKCHEHGHLLRDYPLNKREENQKTNKGKDLEGFTKVGGRGKGGGKRTQKKPSERKLSSDKGFEILEEEEEEEEGTQRIPQNHQREKGKESNMDIIQEQDEHRMDPQKSMELDMDHEMTPSESGTEDQDLQEILERENLELEKFLEQGSNKGIKSLPQEELDRVQQLFLNRSNQKDIGVKRGHDNQENKGVKSMGLV